MKMLEGELARVRSDMEKLRIEESLLIKMIGRMNKDHPQAAKVSSRPHVKPVVLDIMREAGAAGATTAEVDALVKARFPTVAKDTVGSILSRLKGDGALVYVGERYYEKQSAPIPESNSFDSGLRAVN